MNEQISDLKAEHDREFVQRYDYMSGLRQRDWAWEFLRRNTAFLGEAYAMQGQVSCQPSCVPGSKLLKMDSPQPRAREWGLLFFPNPDQPAPRADVFWDPELGPHYVTVSVSACDETDADAFYDKTIASCTIDHLTDSEGTEHLLMRGLFGTGQSKCSGASLLARQGTRKVTLSVQGPHEVDQSYVAYKRAAAILHPGPWEWTERTKRLRNALICLDVKDAGLGLKHAASLIFGEDHVQREWSESKHFRDRVRSLQRTGERLRQGGYRAFLTTSKVDVPPRAKIHDGH